MKLSLVATLMLASPAIADIRAEADALIERAFHEHRVVFNCSEQTPDFKNLVENWMQEAIEDAIPQLTEIGYSAEEIGALMAAGSLPNMLLPDEATVGELRALCAQDPEWQRKFRFLQIVVLRVDLQELIEAQ